MVEVGPFRGRFLFLDGLPQSLQTIDKLIPKGVDMDDECVFCQNGAETVNHLLVQCSVIKGDFCFSSFYVAWVPLVDVKKVLTKAFINDPLS